MHIGFEIDNPKASFCSYEKRAMLTTNSVSCSGIPLDYLLSIRDVAWGHSHDSELYITPAKNKYRIFKGTGEKKSCMHTCINKLEW